MAVTLKDIAEAVGCSTAIVSEVVNNTGRRSRVSAKKRKQILDTVKEMDYVSNLNARRLAGKSTKTIGLIVSPHISIVDSDMVERLSRLLNNKGYRVYANLPLNNEQSLAAIDNFISFGFDGILTVLHTPGIDHCRYSVPVVTVNSKENFDVSFDACHGQYMATRHLMGHGHTKIAFLCDRLDNNRRKFDGYLKALAEDDGTAGSEKVVELFAENNFNQLLDEIIKNQKITAFVTSGDLIASRLMAILVAKGYRIPEDVAVTGYDGTCMVEATACPMTSVMMPVSQLAKEAVDLLIEKIEMRMLKRCDSPILVKGPLFIGGSCGCPRHAPADYGAYNNLPFTVESMLEMINDSNGASQDSYRFESV